jgi:hypothetical protein
VIFVAAGTASSAIKFTLSIPVKDLIWKARQEYLIDYCFGCLLVVRTT